MRKAVVALMAGLLLAGAACSDGTTNPDAVASGPASPDGGGHHDASGGKRSGHHTSKPKHADKKGSGSGGKRHSDGGGNSATGGGKGGGGKNGSAPTSNAAAIYPAAGNYVYAQQGYEEFCNASDCDRRDLPGSQPVSIAYERRADSSAVVVAEQRSSNSRVTRTTATFDRQHSVITKVYVHFSYSGVEFDNTYTPDPPVEALRFPLETGASWSGSWKADTSGEYQVGIGKKETISIGGKRVQAFKIVTSTDFHGQFEGRSRINAWIDPRTQAIVKTDGVLNVTSTFGRYSTVFHTQLRSAPGY